MASSKTSFYFPIAYFSSQMFHKTFCYLISRKDLRKSFNRSSKKRKTEKKINKINIKKRFSRKFIDQEIKVYQTKANRMNKNTY